MATDDEWITWAQAAELVGCPVPTIDWNTRQGRIERRPHLGSRPTLKRSSVLGFAAWRTARQEERDARQRARPAPAGPAGWLTSRQAAERLGLSREHMPWLVRRGELAGTVCSGRLWVDPDSVDRFAGERARWVSMTRAAEVADCSPALIAEAVKRGEIAQRNVGRAYPSLERESVLAWADQRRERLERQAQRRAERQCRSELGGRPDLEHVWLTHDQAGELLGVSKRWVSKLASENRLPFTVVGVRRWFREDHLRMVVTARSLERENRGDA